MDAPAHAMQLLHDQEQIAQQNRQYRLRDRPGILHSGLQRDVAEVLSHDGDGERALQRRLQVGVAEDFKVTFGAPRHNAEVRHDLVAQKHAMLVLGQVVPPNSAAAGLCHS